MAVKKVSWRRSNQALSIFSLLLVPAFLFSAEPSVRAYSKGNAKDSFSDNFNPMSWMEQDDCSTKASAFGKEYESYDSDSEDDEVLPDHIMESCLDNMPPILQGFHAYHKSPDSTNPETMVRSFHRILLVGPHGTSKSTTAKALAQDLQITKKVKDASDFIRENHGQTAIALREFFKRLLSRKKGRLIVIIDEIDTLFASYANDKTDHKVNAHTFWCMMDKLAKENPDIIFIGTANHPDSMPQGIKSRFRVQYAYIPFIDSAKWFTLRGSTLQGRKGLRFSTFRTTPQHASAGSKEEAASDSDEEVSLSNLESLEGGLSHRDLELVDSATIIFAYRDGEREAGNLVLKDIHGDRALLHFLDKDKVLNYYKIQEPDEVRQQRNHDDSMKQQKEQHEASMRQASLHQAQGIRANLQAQARQKPQENVSFSTGVGVGINVGCASASGISRATAQHVEDRVLTDEQKELLPAQGDDCESKVNDAAIDLALAFFEGGVDGKGYDAVEKSDAVRKCKNQMNSAMDEHIEGMLEDEPVIFRALFRITHKLLHGKWFK